MEDALTEKLRTLLSNPDALAGISALASSVTGKEVPSPTEEVRTNPHRDARVELLHAMRPFVRYEKQKRLDDLIRIATAAGVLGNLQNTLHHP